MYLRGDIMLLLKNDAFSVKEMREMEDALKNSVLYNLSADDTALSEKLGLKIEYVTDMPDENEAELLPIDDPGYYGLIRLKIELKKYKFACIPEIIHYIFDVGYGNRVTKSFCRKNRGKTESCGEQRTNYMTAAYIMRSEQIARELNVYDHSSPQQDEILFIRGLRKRYEQSETAVIRRIREVRKLNKYA